MAEYVNSAAEGQGHTPPEGDTHTSRAKLAEIKARFLRELDEAEARADEEDDAEPVSPKRELLEKPRIEVEPGKLPEIVRRAERALGQATIKEPAVGIYQRGGTLVRVVRLSETSTTAGVNRPIGTLRVEPVAPYYLRFRLGDVAHWGRWVVLGRGRRAWEPMNPPMDVARILCEAAGAWRNTPPLAGIIEAPTMRPDGSIITVPGYDQATGLYYDPGGTEFPPIPEKPTEEQARAALSTLLEVVCEFPFVSDAAKSVAVAEMMTPLIRPAVPTAPMFANDAPTPGTGKGLLARLPSLIATGRTPSLIGQWADGAEEKRRLLAVMLEGLPVVVIDNVEEPLKSDTLCTILTEGSIRERIVRTSRTATGDARLTWIVTGNNLVVGGDLPRRTLVCRMDANVERPEDRQFKVNLMEDVPRRRGELAAAVLTIVRAYIAAGSPCSHIQPYGGFEQWSRLVREPLVWLGMADPLETREVVRAKNPDLDRLHGLLAAWHEAHRDRPMTIPEAARDINVRLAMLDIGEKKDGKVDGRKVGNFLAKYEGRWVRGLRVDATGETKQNYALWCVRKAP